jgi:hypothetical protein
MDGEARDLCSLKTCFSKALTAMITKHAEFKEGQGKWKIKGEEIIAFVCFRRSSLTMNNSKTKKRMKMNLSG